MAMFPAPLGDVEKEVRAVIKRDGIDNLRSKAVRQHLSDKFGSDFSSLRSEVDEVIKSQILAIEQEKVNNASPKAPKPATDSDSDSDPGVASTDRRAVKRKAPRSSAVVEDDHFSDEDLLSAVKKRRRAATKVTEKRGSRGSKTPNDNAKKKPKKRSTYSKLCYISDELMAITQKRYMPRHEVVKVVWAYVKEKDLFLKTNKQFAVCDDALLAIFKAKRFRLFGMMKRLSQGHVIKPEAVSPEAVAEAQEEEDRLTKLHAEADGSGDEENGEGVDGEEEEKEDEDDE